MEERRMKMNGSKMKKKGQEVCVLLRLTWITVEIWKGATHKGVRETGYDICLNFKRNYVVEPI